MYFNWYFEIIKKNLIILRTLNKYYKKNAQN